MEYGRVARKIKRRRGKKASTVALLMIAWLEASERWKKIPSDPRMRELQLARSAYYLASSGAVPTVNTETARQFTPLVIVNELRKVGGSKKNTNKQPKYKLVALVEQAALF